MVNLAAQVKREISTCPLDSIVWQVEKQKIIPTKIAATTDHLRTFMSLSSSKDSRYFYIRLHVYNNKKLLPHFTFLSSEGYSETFRKNDLFLVFGVRDFYPYPEVLESNLRRKVLL